MTLSIISHIFGSFSNFVWVYPLHQRVTPLYQKVTLLASMWIFQIMCRLNSTVKSNHFNVTTVVNLAIDLSGTNLLQTAQHSASHAAIHHNKMDGPKVFFELSTILSATYNFRCPCHQPFGWKHFTRRCTSSTYIHPRGFTIKHFTTTRIRVLIAIEDSGIYACAMVELCLTF